MRRTIRNLTLTGLALLALAGGTLTVQRAAQAQVTLAAFASTPVFDGRGTAFAVFGGGTIVQLEAAAQQAGATGVWAQDGAGAYQLLVVKGPSFLTAPFAAAFPGGFNAATAVTLVRPIGGAPAATGTTTTPPPPAATGTATATTTPVATATPAVSTFDAAVSQSAFELTNVQRTSNGLGTLTRNSKLNASAAAYARVVFEKDPYLSNPANAHTMDGQPWDRATRVGYEWATFAENVFIAASTEPPTAAAVGKTTVDGWMNSPPHRANILTAGYVDTGVGCYSGTPASPKPQLGFVVVCVGVYGTQR